MRLLEKIANFCLSGFRNAGEFGEMNEPRRFALLVEERRPPNGTGDDDAVGLVDVPGDPSPSVAKQLTIMVTLTVALVAPSPCLLQVLTLKIYTVSGANCP